MRLSTQLFIIQLHNGWKGIYSPFGHGMAILSEDIWNKLEGKKYENVDSTIIQYLMENNILVEDDFEKAWLRENFRIPAIRFNSMYLVTTLECNFACKYCVVEGNVDSPLRSKERMTPTMASIAIDFFEKQLHSSQPKDARLTFYGGEPMLNRAVIHSSVPKISAIRYPNQKSPVQIVVITNGYIYDPKITELFKKYGVGVCVSIDGMKHHHDAARITKEGGNPTFDRVMENYRKYQSSGLSMGITCTIGKHNAYDLPEIAEFFAEELKPSLVEFQTPYQVPMNGNVQWIQVGEVTDNIMEAYKVLHSKGIIEGLTYRRYRNIINGTINHIDCGSCGTQIVVAPDGMIGPCHSLVGSRTFFEGNVTDPDCTPEKMGNFNQWAARFPFNMPACTECSFISICGGGCPYNSYVASGSIWNKDPQVCKYMEKMIEWILRANWEKAGLASVIKEESKGS